MKLLFDQNISYKLVSELTTRFPGSTHVSLENLQTASDEEIWRYARNNGFVIVTQDSDFYERGVIAGFPPKVIWIRTGNVSTHHIKQILIDNHESIQAFEKDHLSGCLVIY